MSDPDSLAAVLDGLVHGRRFIYGTGRTGCPVRVLQHRGLIWELDGLWGLTHAGRDAQRRGALWDATKIPSQARRR